jgi:hypothetical protein
MINPTLIKPNMTVVCSKNVVFGVVEHLQGTDTVKLVKDANGNHHFFPLSWVESVGRNVHLDRPVSEAVRGWSTIVSRRKPSV